MTKLLLKLVLVLIVVGAIAVGWMFYAGILSYHPDKADQAKQKASEMIDQAKTMGKTGAEAAKDVVDAVKDASE